jgi:hypothetical protein
MKKVLLATFVLPVFLCAAQKTVQFADPLPPNYNLVKTVDAAHFGSYKPEGELGTYVFDKDGISLVTTLVSYVTREQVRESSKLQVRNGCIFGIKGTDSIPCYLEGEKYYYGIENRKPVVGGGELSQLTRIDARTYIVNFLIDGYFEPSLFRFDGGKLAVIHSDNEWKPEYRTLLEVRTLERNGNEIRVLAPAADQWPKLKEVIFENKPINYVKE